MKKICCICKEKYWGFGNNPYPIRKKGRCCNKCNSKVIVARLKKISINVIVDKEIIKNFNNLMEKKENEINNI